MRAAGRSQLRIRLTVQRQCIQPQLSGGCDCSTFATRRCGLERLSAAVAVPKAEARLQMLPGAGVARAEMASVPVHDSGEFL